MRAPLGPLVLAVTLAALGAFAPRGASAGGAAVDSDTWSTGQTAESEWGLGLRGRYVTIPRPVFELFVDEASSGLHQPGGGVELLRRSGSFELNIGVEFERLSPRDGLWLDRGDQPPEETPDRVEFDGFGWVTADVTAVWHEPLHEKFAVRYGAGLGVGVVRGDILRTDTECTGADTASCEPIGESGDGRYREAEDVPRVVPVVNALLGFQLRPTDRVSWNVEAGLRSVFYAGTSIGLFF